MDSPRFAVWPSCHCGKPFLLWNQCQRCWQTSCWKSRLHIGIESWFYPHCCCLLWAAWTYSQSSGLSHLFVQSGDLLLPSVKTQNQTGVEMRLWAVKMISTQTAISVHDRVEKASTGHHGVTTQAWSGSVKYISSAGPSQINWYACYVFKTLIYSSIYFDCSMLPTNDWPHLISWHLGILQILQIIRCKQWAGEKSWRARAHSL